MTTVYEPPQSPKAQAAAAGKEKPERTSPYFMRRSQSLYYIGVKADHKTGAFTHTTPLRLGSDIELLGSGVDEHGDHYRIARVHPQDGERAQELAIPRELLGTARGWALLRAKGASVHNAPNALVYLADYLQDEGGHLRYHITKQAGWHGRAYILPGGALIGDPGQPTFYYGDYHLADIYRPSNDSAIHPHGDPTLWRDHVASLARGNSRIMLALGSAFGAPLLRLMGMESGGVHLYGTTTDGKTTAALVGASVWGQPNKQKLSWDATTYALSNEAAIRNDGLMILDEVGQAQPGTVAQAAYNLFNGKGKLQGKAEGGNRLTKSWTVMVISTGEFPVDTFVTDSGARFNGGQEVRLPSIPSDAGYGMGILECLHHHPSPEAFANTITTMAATHYGSAGRAFLAHLQTLPESTLKARIDTATHAWYAALTHTTSLVKRVARRFALMAEALEIATECGLTGWHRGEATAAIWRCFMLWYLRNGQSKTPEASIIEQAEAFFATHGLNRFHRLRPGRPLEPCYGRDAAGYIRQHSSGGVYLVYPGVFEKEIAKGFDRSKVVEVLRKAGMLNVPDKGSNSSNNSNRPCKPHRVPSDIDPKQTTTKRLYEFVSVVRPEEDPDQTTPPGPSMDAIPQTPSVMAASGTTSNAQNNIDTHTPEATTPARTEPATMIPAATTAPDTTTQTPPSRVVPGHVPGTGSPPASPSLQQGTSPHATGQPPDPQQQRAQHNDPPD